MTAKFDYTKQDAMAMPVTPVDPVDFNVDRYEEFAAEADRSDAKFLATPEGIAVGQCLA